MKNIELNFSTPKDGIYRVKRTDIKEREYSAWTHFYNQFRNEVKLDSAGSWGRATIFEGYENAEYIISSDYGVDYASGGYRGSVNYEVYFMHPIISLNGELTIKDTYTEAEVFAGLTSGDGGVFRCYKFTPGEAGTYIISFDNIEISKDKRLYAENVLFSIYMDVLRDGGYSTENIYVHGKNAYYKVDLEEGKEYAIYLSVYQIENSEEFHNGDVRFSMNIKKGKEEYY